MKKDLVRLAMIGLAAGFCMSAEAAPTIRSNIAMSKCSKDTSDKGNNSDDQSSCSGKSGCGSCSSSSLYTPSNQSKADESTAKSEVKSGRKSAAQKVLEGQ